MQQLAAAGPIKGISEIEDGPRRGIDPRNPFSLSDCEESTVSCPGIHTVHPQFPAAQTCETDSTGLVRTKPLPEKGKLLQAVLKAGPLLQTLLLAGPLPQWRRPPPPLMSTDIPPARMPSLPRALAPPTEFILKDIIINTSSATCKIIEDYTAATGKRALCDTHQLLHKRRKVP
ncbi:hypothetical protein MLD38_025265 [Melastoma candidum]|uniref:Uncharacterized protein n=1 Tax=Melastoma candidum TaxID=119954 RepID=A0ACB9NWG1_9MYRT|nr:hypothetical protein MLD38_025265 [Melastoma candidum]